MTDWISIDERMPEDNAKVLLYTPEDDAIRIGWHIKRRWDTCPEWVFVTAINGHLTRGMKPSHWCPLPEKPGRE